MSVYNFNDREHETDEGQQSSRSFTGNGIARRAGYHQIESDFLSRNSVDSSNHVGNPIQMTRPTSKTVLLVRQKRAMLEQLSCFICKGYLIDATTLDECMDSFCKSCIVLHLRNHRSCPKCGAVIQHSNQFSAVKPDRVLQDIVYKLIPGLYDDEMKRRRDFYREYYGVQQSSSDEEDGDSSSSTLTVQGSSLSGERYGVVLHPKPFYKPTDSIDLSIEPQTRGDNKTIYYDNKRQSIVTCFTGSLQQRDLNNDSGSVFSSVDSQLFKTYLRCPAKLTALQLKKFIAAKFNIFRDDTIHLLYLNESLREEYSLIDVAYIYDWRGTEHMQLFYIIERDLMKVATSDSQPNNHLRAPKQTRQSVGISTQTVKRVCIDPKPKFYEEKNNNDVGLNISTEGRSMRPRVESPASSATRTSQAVHTNPIIRTHFANTAEKTLSFRTNATSTRDQAAGQSVARPRQVVERTSSPNRNQVIHVPAANGVRSLRSQATAVKTSQNKERTTINVGLGSMGQGSSVQGSATAQDRERGIVAVSRHNSISQIVPYKSNRFDASQNTTARTSFVTLASFTEAKTNNMITSVSSSSASVQTLVNDRHGLVYGSSESYKQPDYSPVSKVIPVSKVQAAPQLCLRIVTERGVTMVRRFENQDNSAAISTARNNAANLPNLLARSSVGAAQTPATTANSTGNQVHHPQTSSANLNLISSQPISQSSSSHRVNEDAATSRHNLKAKPIYKQFVDPTKLKSPNLKKLGYTARH